MKRMNHWLRAAWAAVIVALLLAGSHSPLIAATLMYVSNSGNGTISAVANDGSVSTFATGLQQPAGLALDRWGNLYAGDLGVGGGLVGTIKKITPDGHVSTWAAGFNWPNALAFDDAGNLYVCIGGSATTSNAIVRITPGGSVSIFTTAVQNPCALAFDRSGNLFAADYWDHTISKITPDGTVSTFASGFSGRLDALAFDAVGNLYVVNLDGGVIQKITPQGSISTFATGESWPGGLAFDQSGNLYLSDYLANRVERVGPAGGSVSTFATGFSYPNGIAMVPHGLNIVTPPQSQTAQAGNSVTFSVVATGTAPLSYQWQKDGVNIAGATSPALNLTSVSAGNSGAYSVVVWNAINSVVSAAASLAVLADCANGNTPTQTSGPPGPTKPAGKNNLVVVTHGCQSGPQVPSPPQWVSDICTDIQARATSDWQVFPYFWTAEAWAYEDPSRPLSPAVTFVMLETKVMPNAKSLGVQLGTQIAAQGWQHVHFIGHSAGAALIQKATDTLRSLVGAATEIHTTFLDPYLDANYYGKSWYGQNADWADCYYALDWTASATDGPLSYAYSVDVTWLDPQKTVTPIPCASSTADSTAPVLDHYCSMNATSTHEWPYYFYSNSIVGTLPACPAAAGYGFPMSKEGGGWANRGNYPPNGNPPVPCGSAAVSQNPLPLATGQPLQFAGLPYAASPSGLTLFGGGFTMSGLSSQLVQQGDTKGGVISNDGPQPQDVTNGPVWLAVGLTITNPVNFVAFEAGFTSTNAGQGLLTVYWNTNVIGMVDQRVALSSVQTYRFTLPGTVTNGLYTLGFRLDTFTNITSSITVTNVATGFVGITQPISLDMRLMGSNNTPVLKLTAAPGYNYLVQSSTNLVDWVPSALLVNTNGAVLFADPALTNGNARFYRAMMP